jgi:predicted metal-dependent phosphoesterase TrpH
MDRSAPVREDTVAPASYDLHLHTSWSYDAEADLRNHFERAKTLGVGCIAITEHHVLDSIPDVIAMSSQYPEVRVIPSAELTVTTSIGAVDLLCYGFPSQTTSLQPVLDAYHTWQQDFGAATCKGLQALGHDYTDTHRAALLDSYRPTRTIDVQGQTHVSNKIQRSYFVERGFIDHIDDYRDLLRAAGEKVPFPLYPAVDFVIPSVKELGVVVAIAHPHGYFAQANRERMDTLRAECTLDGVECAHQSVPADFTPIYRQYCVEHGLFSTGGSDSHTNEDVQTKFALHGGDNAWLGDLLGRIEDRVLN